MKILKTKNLALILALSTAFIACDDDDNSTNPEDPSVTEETVTIPETITISETNLFPEGIDYNNNDNQFYISSIRRGEVGVVNPQTGEYSTFVTDPSLINATGVLIDEASDRLFAVSGNAGLSGVTDPAVGSVAYLGVYNLGTGDLIEGIDLGSLNTGSLGVFANDIALDADGNIYVTDSFSPFVYKVDGTTFEASIFVDGGDDFTPPEGGFGLNGIVYIDGNLVVGHTSSGILYRIPLEDPTAFAAIDIEDNFERVDGLEVDTNGEIIVVRNGFAGEASGFYSIASTDDWVSATTTSVDLLDAMSFPTTAALAADGEIYAVNSYFTVLFDEDDTNDDQDTFSIVRR